jgi:hypothetical protein
MRGPLAAVGCSACCAFLLAALAAAPEARSHHTPWAWPYVTLIEQIAGERVKMPTGSVRIDRDLVICNGEGRPVRRAGARRWKHFTCTQTLFDRNGITRDVTFRVHILGRTRFLVSDVRYGPV